MTALLRAVLLAVLLLVLIGVLTGIVAAATGLLEKLVLAGVGVLVLMAATRVRRMGRRPSA